MITPLVVLYDAECSLCRASKARLEAIDPYHRLKLLPLQDPWTQAHLPNVDAWELRRVMHVVRADGRVFTGAAAYREIGRVVSPQSWLGLLFRAFAWASYVPGVMPLAEQIYQAIADRRFGIR